MPSTHLHYVSAGQASSGNNAFSALKMALIAVLVCAVAALWMPLRAHAFAVTPALLELSGARGETVKSAITVINDTAAPRTYYLQAIKFVPREDSGAPTFIPYETDHEGLPEWVKFESRAVAVPAGSKAEVPITIAIPNDAASGGQYGAIVVSDTPSDVVATNGAAINANIAVLVFLTVEGETIEKAALLDFTSPEQGSVLAAVAGSFRYRLQNQGNVHVTPTGTVTVRDLFGRTIAAADANSGRNKVLPGVTRTFEGVFGRPTAGLWDTLKVQFAAFAIGPMTATLELDSVGSDPITSRFGFWVFPWQMLSVIVLSVAAAWFAVRGIKKK